MSYARGTTNYNLPQTQGTDKRDWSDTNAAFLAIDTAIKTANDTASSASSAASTAQTRADNAYTLASAANTAAGNAATAAATAGELAQTAKNRADSAYTLADGKLAKTDVVNNLATTASGKALDARQGKALNDKIEGLIKYQQFDNVSTDVNGNIVLTGLSFSNVAIISASTSAVNAQATVWIDSNSQLYNVHVTDVYATQSAVVNTQMSIGVYYVEV